MFSAAVDKESSSSYILGIPPVTQSEKESLYHDRKHRTAQIQDGPNSGKNRLLTTATAAPHFSQQQQQQQQEQQPRKSSSNDLASKDSGISGSSDSPLSCAATPVRAQRVQVADPTSAFSINKYSFSTSGEFSESCSPAPSSSSDEGHKAGDEEEEGQKEEKKEEEDGDGELGLEDNSSSLRCSKEPSPSSLSSSCSSTGSKSRRKMFRKTRKKALGQQKAVGGGSGVGNRSSPERGAAGGGILISRPLDTSKNDEEAIAEKGATTVTITTTTTTTTTCVPKFSPSDEMSAEIGLLSSSEALNLPLNDNSGRLPNSSSREIAAAAAAAATTTTSSTSPSVIATFKVSRRGRRSPGRRRRRRRSRSSSSNRKSHSSSSSFQKAEGGAEAEAAAAAATPAVSNTTGNLEAAEDRKVLDSEGGGGRNRESKEEEEEEGQACIAMSNLKPKGAKDNEPRRRRRRIGEEKEDVEENGFNIHGGIEGKATINTSFSSPAPSAVKIENGNTRSCISRGDTELNNGSSSEGSDTSSKLEQGKGYSGHSNALLALSEERKEEILKEEKDREDAKEERWKKEKKKKKRSSPLSSKRGLTSTSGLLESRQGRKELLLSSPSPSPGSKPLSKSSPFSPRKERSKLVLINETKREQDEADGKGGGGQCLESSRVKTLLSSDTSLSPIFSPPTTRLGQNEKYQKKRIERDFLSENLLRSFPTFPPSPSLSSTRAVTSSSRSSIKNLLLPSGSGSGGGFGEPESRKLSQGSSNDNHAFTTKSRLRNSSSSHQRLSKPNDDDDDCSDNEEEKGQDEEEEEEEAVSARSRSLQKMDAARDLLLDDRPGDQNHRVKSLSPPVLSKGRDPVGLLNDTLSSHTPQALRNKKKKNSSSFSGSGNARKKDSSSSSSSNLVEELMMMKGKRSRKKKKSSFPLAARSISATEEAEKEGGEEKDDISSAAAFLSPPPSSILLPLSNSSEKKKTKDKKSKKSLLLTERDTKAESQGLSSRILKKASFIVLPNEDVSGPKDNDAVKRSTSEHLEEDERVTEGKERAPTSDRLGDKPDGKGGSSSLSQDLFLSHEQPDYAKSYILPRVMQRDPIQARRLRRQQAPAKSSGKSKSRDTFKFSMLKTTLDYESRMPQSQLQTSPPSIMQRLPSLDKGALANVPLGPFNSASVHSLIQKRKRYRSRGSSMASSVSGAATVTSGGGGSSGGVYNNNNSSSSNYCKGPGSLKSYIDYVQADGFVPFPVLEPEKGVEFALYADEPSSQGINEDSPGGAESSFNSRSSSRVSWRSLSNYHGDITSQFENIQSLAEESQKESAKFKKTLPPKKRLSTQYEEMESLDFDFDPKPKKPPSTSPVKKRPDPRGSNPSPPAGKRKGLSRKESEEEDDDPLGGGNSKPLLEDRGTKNGGASSLFLLPSPFKDGVSGGSSDLLDFTKDDQATTTTDGLSATGDGESFLDLFIDRTSVFGSERHPALPSVAQKLDSNKQERGRSGQNIGLSKVSSKSQPVKD